MDDRLGSDEDDSPANGGSSINALSTNKVSMGKDNNIDEGKDFSQIILRENVEDNFEDKDQEDKELENIQDKLLQAHDFSDDDDTENRMVELEGENMGDNFSKDIDNILNFSLDDDDVISDDEAEEKELPNLTSIDNDISDDDD